MRKTGNAYKPSWQSCKPGALSRTWAEISYPFAVLVAAGRSHIRTRLLAPDVLAEPLVIVFQHSELLFRLIDRVAESLIEDQLDRDACITQPLVKLKRIRWR